MLKYKWYTFAGKSINVTECEIDDEDLLKYLNYKIGTRGIFSPHDDYEYAGQICKIVDYIKYSEDDWCYNVKFNNCYEQRIYEEEFELIEDFGVNL